MLNPTPEPSAIAPVRLQRGVRHHWAKRVNPAASNARSAADGAGKTDCAQKSGATAKAAGSMTKPGEAEQ